ncbi:hypothetical protein [Jeongeupia chitinilytica]|uniref:Uncharacterized protein n=1 Tax=Jeongeupia chitinilytica TaxID=1041641 RepID=A0ABQ3GYR7_9NEIS|nr:hypothetical protein [Jeongeupia chitinilytica]GHD59119.1 hypothetical protein GCM10007350_10080 [Jeongeupia chitinilytica]
MPKAAPSIPVLAPPTLIDALAARASERDPAPYHWLPLPPDGAPPLPARGRVVLVNGTLDDLQRLLRPELTIVDVVVHGDTTQAQRFGWMIGAGGSARSLAETAPLLDALAPPARQAWLHLGSGGSAAFVASLLQQWQVQTLAILGWLGGTPRAQWAYDPAIWQQITQTTLAQAQQDALRYLGMTAEQPFEPVHPIPASLQHYFPGKQPPAPIAPATQLAQLLLSIPALPAAVS